VEQIFRQADAGTYLNDADYVAPSAFFELVECNELPGVNAGRFCDRPFDARINKARSDQSMQAGVAAQEWSAIDQTVVNDAVDVPISNSLEPDFVARRVGNFEYNPMWGCSSMSSGFGSSLPEDRPWYLIPAGRKRPTAGAMKGATRNRCLHPIGSSRAPSLCLVRDATRPANGASVGRRQASTSSAPP
jgi:hypothetical protein